MSNWKEELGKIVGSEYVSDDRTTLEAYAKDQSFTRPLKPWFVVKPNNAEEVQAIVKWSNRTKTPLVPISSGPPHFHGDTVPSAAGAVMIDLSRMNRIIRIDRRNRMTIIEPGVTYGQLLPELSREGLSLSTPLLPRHNKSVVASLLEREPIMIPKYQTTIFEPLRCLEIIWGSGDKFRTGEAGSRLRSLEEQWAMQQVQLNPMGPGQTDFFRLVSAAQGTMGVITWASLKCERLPQIQKLFFLPANRLDDLIDCAYKLVRVRLGDELMLLNSSDLASILGKSADQISTLKAEMPPWVIIIDVAGRNVLPKERVEVQEKAIMSIAQQFGLKPMSAIPGAGGDEVLQAILNPSKEPHWKLGYKGGCQDIFFLTTLNRIPEFIKTMYSLAEALRYSTSEIGIYIQPLHQGVGCHCEFSLPFDPGDQREIERIQELLNRASEELIKQGAYFSRPYGIWANITYHRDAQTTAILKKMKGVFDPNGVMNPGKLCF